MVSQDSLMYSYWFFKAYLFTHIFLFFNVILKGDSLENGDEVERQVFLWLTHTSSFLPLSEGPPQATCSQCAWPTTLSTSPLLSSSVPPASFTLTLTEHFCVPTAWVWLWTQMPQPIFSLVYLPKHISAHVLILVDPRSFSTCPPRWSEL